MLANKDELLTHVRDLGLQAGGTLKNIGGDCYVIIVSGEVRLAVAIKESNGKDRLWVGSPLPIYALLAGELEMTELNDEPLPIYRAFIVLTHPPYKTVLLVPFHGVYRDSIHRSNVKRSETMRMDFDIRRIGYKKYVIKTDSFVPDIEIKNVDTFEPLSMLLATKRSEF